MGRPLVGEEPAYADAGPRVCDAAYNLLMRERKDRPAEFPLDVSGDSLATRDRLVTQLAAELGVPGPMPAGAKPAVRAPPAAPGEENPAHGQGARMGSTVSTAPPPPPVSVAATMKSGTMPWQRGLGATAILAVLLAGIVFAVKKWRRSKGEH